MKTVMMACAFVAMASVAAMAQTTAPTNEGAGGTPSAAPAGDPPAAQSPAETGGTSSMSTMKPKHQAMKKKMKSHKTM